MNGVICLEAMELFLEGKNKNYSLILELINSLYYEDRKTISSKEINDSGRKQSVVSCSVGVIPYLAKKFRVPTILLA